MAASLYCLIFIGPGLCTEQRAAAGDNSRPGGNRSGAGNPEPLYPRRDGNRGGQRHRRGGKEFYTITTADESVFYLVIDKQKTSENVYFLNTVTTDDLLPLAEQGKEPPKEMTPEPEPSPPNRWRKYRNPSRRKRTAPSSLSYP